MVLIAVLVSCQPAGKDSNKAAVQPLHLTKKLIKQFSDLLKLRYPIRVGTHTNTAFGLSFAINALTQ